MLKLLASPQRKNAPTFRSCLLSSLHLRPLPHALGCRLSCPKAPSKQSRLPQSWHAVGGTRKRGAASLAPEDSQISRTITRSLIYYFFLSSGKTSVSRIFTPLFFLLRWHEGGVEAHPRRGKKTLLQRRPLFLSFACQCQRSLGLTNGAAPLEKSADPDDDRYRLPALVVPRGRRSPGTDPSCSDVYGLRRRARIVCDSAPSQTYR